MSLVLAGKSTCWQPLQCHLQMLAHLYRLLHMPVSWLGALLFEYHWFAGPPKRIELPRAENESVDVATLLYSLRVPKSMAFLTVLHVHNPTLSEHRRVYRHTSHEQFWPVCELKVVQRHTQWPSLVIQYVTQGHQADSIPSILHLQLCHYKKEVQ